MRGYAIALLFLMSSILPTSMFSQKKVPDLNGIWRLNAAKSTWAGTSSLEWRIKQVGDRIVVEIIADQVTNRLEYVVDGLARVAGVVPGSDNKITARASWEGRELKLITVFQDPALLEMTSRFGLSADGKVLSVRRVMGDLDKTLVFEKQ